MALHRDGKNDNNSPQLSDFLKLKMTIRISYKCKHLKVPNLVYFESQSRHSEIRLDFLGPFFFAKNVKKSIRKLTFFG